MTMDALGPLIKLPGGKTTLAPQIVQRMPASIERYVEPFCGGAAVFCELVRQGRLATASVIINDLDVFLAEAYVEVKERPEPLAAKLAELKTLYDTSGKARELYFSVRDSWNNDSKSVVKRIFLSQAAFNGLWRENKSGGMNADWSRRAKITLPTREKIMALSMALRNAEVHNEDFERVFEPLHFTPGTVVYMDPPYLKTWNEYKKGGFGLLDHIRLLKLCRKLGESGATVVLSNDAEETTQRLVAQHWPEAKVDFVYALRRINRDGAGRGPVPELLCSQNGVM